MKKLASFVLALAMAAVCAVPALAEYPDSSATSASSDTTATTSTEITQSSDPKSVRTEVKFNIDPTYTVEIPADTAIDFNTTSETLTTNLGLSTARLDRGFKVTVTAKVNPLQNDKDSSQTIPFTLYADNSPFSKAEFTNTNDKVQLSVHIDQSDWNKAPAGSYTGSVTFTIAYGKEEG